MPTDDYTRGWKAALAEAARQFDAAGWSWQAGHLRALDREANIAAAYAAEPAPACRVGGDPPVPGVGWGVMSTVGAGSWRVVWPIRRVTIMAGGGWSIGLDSEDGRALALNEIAALYRPGDAADEPCWRRE